MHLNEISYLLYIYNAVHLVSNVSLKIVENVTHYGLLSICLIKGYGLKKRINSALAC